MFIARGILPASLLLASCGVPSSAGEGAGAVENAVPATMIDAAAAFTMEPVATYDEPWAMAFVPGTSVLMVTMKGGTIAGIDTASGLRISVNGVPRVDYGGQGGLGDIAFLRSESADGLTAPTIYLSYAEAGPNDTRGAAVGRGRLVCETAQSCTIKEFAVIWRQEPKVTGRGHYSHRLAFSPDGTYLFVSSGDRQKGEPAQDTSNTLGTIVRLLPDGTAAPGNPLAGQDGADPTIWSWGHRNVLGLAFDGEGQLWDLEHGPKGGDELNRVEPGSNYGWPIVSNGRHYNGQAIPNHATRPDFAPPAISWDPVIAPGDLIFPEGEEFPFLEGKALAAGLATQALVAVELIDGRGREAARYQFDNRLRALAEAPDGALWVAEDGPGATLWRLTARQAD